MDSINCPNKKLKEVEVIFSISGKTVVSVKVCVCGINNVDINNGTMVIMLMLVLRFK